MALFSDNPFVGVFRAQKRRESEAAMAAQQTMAEQRQKMAEQRQKNKTWGQMSLGERAEAAKRSGLTPVIGGNPNQKEIHAYGLGGFNPWRMQTFQNPQTGAMEKAPALKSGYVSGNTSPEGRYLFAVSNMGNPFPKRQVTVLPSGIHGRQEYRSQWEGKGMVGYDVIESPEKFVRGKGTSERDRTNAFYSASTGRPLGTILGTGAYGGFGKDATDEQGRPYSKYSPQIMERRAKRGLNPFAAESTGKFTETSRPPTPMPAMPISEEEIPSMFGEYFGSPFGRIQFPFANY